MCASGDFCSTAPTGGALRGEGGLEPLASGPAGGSLHGTSDTFCPAPCPSCNSVCGLNPGHRFACKHQCYAFRHEW
jgi:hypothetical protein